jgi:hypothetical protein
VDHWRDVAHAVWNEQRRRMRYESWTEVAEREIEPLGLVVSRPGLPMLALILLLLWFAMHAMNSVGKLGTAA